MKLNKVMALALSGLMAVSMLAGCAGNPDGGDNGEQPPVVDNTVSGRVIAALDSDTTDKVNFQSNSYLLSVLENYVQVKGTNVGESDLIGYDADLGSTGVIPQVKENANGVGQTEPTDKEAYTYLKVAKLNTVGASESYAIHELAKAIDNQVVGYYNLTSADLPEMSGMYDSGKYWYDFDYTGSVAVTAWTDSVTGQTTYIMAYSVTRTPTKTER